MRMLGFMFVIIAVSIAAIYLMSAMVLTNLSERAIDYLMQNIKIARIEFKRPSFNSVRVSSYNAVTWYGLTMDATILQDDIWHKVEHISGKIDEFTITLENIVESTILLAIRGISVERKGAHGGASLQMSGEKIEGADLEIAIKLEKATMAGIMDQVGRLSEEIRKFTQAGVTTIPIQFSAKETFAVGGKFYTVKLSMLKERDEYRLIVDEDSIRELGAIGGNIPPTSGDIKLLSRNPLKISELLFMREKAESMASYARKADPNVPEDAYRHTLWSYMLANAFGGKFAKEVGDAHESEADEEEVKGNKPFMAASYMDFNNNAMGRSYAKKGYAESSILRHVLTDPAIIRDKDMMQRYNPSDMAIYRSRMDR